VLILFNGLTYTHYSFAIINYKCLQKSKKVQVSRQPNKVAGGVEEEYTPDDRCGGVEEEYTPDDRCGGETEIIISVRSLISLLRVLRLLLGQHAPNALYQ
jgi:hypothetical protein